MYRQICWKIPFACINNLNVKFLITNNLGPNVLNRVHWLLYWVHFPQDIYVYRHHHTCMGPGRGVSTRPMIFYIYSFSNSGGGWRQGKFLHYWYTGWYIIKSMVDGGNQISYQLKLKIGRRTCVVWYLSHILPYNSNRYISLCGQWTDVTDGCNG